MTGAARAGSRVVAGIGATISGKVSRFSPARASRWLSFRWVAIAVIVVGWFVYYPIIDNFIVSTTDEDIFTGEVSYVGIDNYVRLLNDPVVWSSFWNNCLYAVISIRLPGLRRLPAGGDDRGAPAGALAPILARRLLRSVRDLHHRDGPAVLLHLPAEDRAARRAARPPGARAARPAVARQRAHRDLRDHHHEPVAGFRLFDPAVCDRDPENSARAL